MFEVINEFQNNRSEIWLFLRYGKFSSSGSVDLISMLEATPE